MNVTVAALLLIALAGCGKPKPRADYVPMSQTACDGRGTLSFGFDAEYWVCGKNGLYVLDIENMRQMADEQLHLQELISAMHWRPLTDAEAKEVDRLGVGLVRPQGLPYDEVNLQSRLNALKHIQKLVVEDYKNQNGGTK